MRHYKLIFPLNIFLIEGRLIKQIVLGHFDQLHEYLKQFRIIFIKKQQHKD